ncbi:MAG: hypothetical protein PUB14_09595 [Lachnospiraceae bacterium]|nr:hypothetical protein [Lachnospiraceae bacterium]
MSNFIGQLMALVAVIIALFLAARGISASSKRKGEALRKLENGAITVLQPDLLPVFLVLSLSVTCLLIWLLYQAVSNGITQIAPFIVYIVLVNACALAIGLACRRWKLVLKDETAEYQDWLGRRFTYAVRDIDECRVSRRGVYAYYSKGKHLFSMSGTDAGDSSMVMGTINSRKAIRYLTTFSIPIRNAGDEKALKEKEEDKTVRPGRYLGILRLTAVGTAAMAVRYATVSPARLVGVAVYSAGCAVSIVALLYFHNDRTWIENRCIYQKKWFKVKEYPFTQIRGVERTGDALTFFSKSGKQLFSVSSRYDGYEKFEQEVRRHWRIKSLGQ